MTFLFDEVAMEHGAADERMVQKGWPSLPHLPRNSSYTCPRLKITNPATTPTLLTCKHFLSSLPSQFSPITCLRVLRNDPVASRSPGAPARGLPCHRCCGIDPA